ncbi:MAG: universal stress protein [Myxococcales bacterium]|nr:universal stress protein [Myxococcales bacterium]
MTLRTLLVPVDFSEDSTAALEMAVDLAKALGARIRLLHVFHSPPEIYAPYGGIQPAIPGMAEIPEAAMRCLDLELEKVREAGSEAEGEVREGLPSDAIVAAAREWDADLIVMGTRGHTGLEHVLLGSVAERTLHKAPCPVLTVRAKGS